MGDYYHRNVVWESLVMSQEDDELLDDELVAVLESVHDEETFLQFLIALRDDREASVAQEKAKPLVALWSGRQGMGEHNHRALL